MSEADTCPDDAVLSRVALGALTDDEAGRWLLHLTDCPRCADRLDGLTARDAFLDRLDATAALPPLILADECPAWQPFHRRLRDTADLFAKVQEPLDFLEPAQGPDELGRLGPFRVLELLGHGGMGLVFRGADGRTGQPVALKVLRPSLRNTPGAAERFLREAQSAARVRSEHVVPLLEVGEAGGTPFLAMPLLRGQTLAERLDAGDRLPLAEVVRIARQAAEGLAAVHAAGLVHRDLKPSNLWLAEAEWSQSANVGPVQLLDFGLALRPESDPRLTGSGQVLGTPSYMAPEQVRGEPPRPAADLFSFGCILYEMLTGLKPFAGRDVLATLAALAGDTPADPRRLRPDVPAGLAKLVLQLLAKDPDQRPASARVVADRLAGLDAPSAAPVWLTSSRAFAVGASVLVGLMLLAAWIIPPLLAPRLGTMQTETAEDDLEPLMAAADLRFVDRATGHQVVPRLGPQPLPPGTYELADLRGGGALDIAPETFTLRAGAVATVRVRRAPPPGPLEAERVVQAHPGACHLALSGDGRLLATGENDQVRLWDPASGRLVREWRTPGLTVSRMAFEPNGRRLAGCFNENMTVIWDPETGNELRRLPVIGHWSSGADFHPDGRRLVSTSYRHLEVWDLDSGKRQATGRLPAESNMYMLSTHPAGRFVATPHHDHTIGIWDLDHLTDPRLLTGHAGSVEQVAFRPDGRELASSSFDGTARVWAFPDGQVRLTLRHAFPVRGVAWAGDGRWLLTASRHAEQRLGEVKVWDAKTGRECYSSRLDARQFYVAGTPSGRRFATAGEDGKLRIWQLPD